MHFDVSSFCALLCLILVLCVVVMGAVSNRHPYYVKSAMNILCCSKITDFGNKVSRRCKSMKLRDENVKVDSSPAIRSWLVRIIETNSGRHGDTSFFQTPPNY